MPFYYVNINEQPTGEHEVHRDTCTHLPEPKNRIDLGYCSNCREAIEKAKEYYNRVDGCKYCSGDCHKK